MNWFEIVIKIPTEQCEIASAVANITVPYGIYIEDYSDMESQSWEIAHIDLIDEELLAKDRSSALIHIYIDKSENPMEAVSFIKERFNAENIKYEVSFGEVEDIDWNEYWKTFFHTTEIGEKLAVVPKWENYDNKNDRKILSINPGAAFGTGTHATTSLCLQLLEQRIKGGETVLDIGCGSCILSIAGVLLGGESAVGVDIDEAAVKVAKENAAMNCVEDKTEYICGDLAEKVNGKFDVVCANIVADVIIRLLDNVANFMNEDALLIASGIIESRAEEVKSVIISKGFKIEEELTKENWYAFAIIK
jgi:ribosomal protein L11 methyltransferase